MPLLFTGFGFMQVLGMFLAAQGDCGCF